MNERKPAAAAAHAVFSDHCGAPLLYIAAKIEECSHSPFMNLNSRLQFRRFVFPSPFHCLLPCSIMRPSPSATTVAGFGAPPPPPSSLSPSPTYLSVPDLNAAANLFSHRCSLSSSWISIRISLPLLRIRHRAIIDRSDPSLNRNPQGHVHVFAWNHSPFRMKSPSVVPDLR